MWDSHGGEAPSKDNKGLYGMLDNTTAMQKNRKCGTVNDRKSHFDGQPNSVIVPSSRFKDFDKKVLCALICILFQ